MTAPLPGVLAEIAEVAGRAAAVEVSLAWGGDWIHFPKSAHLARHPEHPLAALLGVKNAGAVAARVGGGSVYVPFARRACARHLAGEGLAVRAIADRIRTSPKTVRRYIRDA